MTAPSLLSMPQGVQRRVALALHALRRGNDAVEHAWHLAVVARQPGCSAADLGSTSAGQTQRLSVQPQEIASMALRQTATPALDQQDPHTEGWAMIRDRLAADVAESLAQVQSLGLPTALHQSHLAVLATLQEHPRDLRRLLPSAGMVDSAEGEGAERPCPPERS